MSFNDLNGPWRYDQHPLGYGREAYFWALIAALGVFVGGAAFSLRDGILELIHPRPRTPVHLRRSGPGMDRRPD
jgi:hypothetical protein